MKAILIEPEQYKVSLILYDSLFFGGYQETISHILGAPLDWITEFPNKDGLFSKMDSVCDCENRAFTLQCSDIVFFGKSLIVSVSSPPYMSLRNSQFTLADICKQIHFHDQRMTGLFREQFI